MYTFTCTAAVLIHYMVFHIFICIIHHMYIQTYVYYELTMWQAPSWLESSVGIAQYCSSHRGHKFKSESGQNFFQALISQLLIISCVTIYNCNDHHVFISFSAVQVYGLSCIYLFAILSMFPFSIWTDQPETSFFKKMENSTGLCYFKKCIPFMEGFWLLPSLTTHLFRNSSFDNYHTSLGGSGYLMETHLLYN